MACLSTAESYSYGNYSYARIYKLNVEDFVVETHHGDFFFFFFFISLHKHTAKSSYHTVHHVVRKKAEFCLARM